MTRDTLGIGDEVAVALSRPRVVREFIPIMGDVFLELVDGYGRLKDYQHVKNLVVDAGEVHIADQLSSSPGGNAMSHMALGTGSTAAAFGDTALGTETDRNALTSRTDSANVVTYVGTWAAGDGTNSALREAGIFNAASTGTMLARAVYANIDKQAADSLTIAWTVTIGTAGA
jgi:hypothetical protein